MIAVWISLIGLASCIAVIGVSVIVEVRR